MTIEVFTNDGFASVKHENIGSVATQDGELWLYRGDDHDDTAVIYPKGGWDRAELTDE